MSQSLKFRPYSLNAVFGRQFIGLEASSGHLLTQIVLLVKVLSGSLKYKSGKFAALPLPQAFLSISNGWAMLLRSPLTNP